MASMLNRMRKVAAASLMVILAALVGGCGFAAAPIGPTPEQNKSLSNTSWRLVSLNGQSVLSGTAVTLNFENGRLNGTDGCNQYSASYTANGATFTVGKDIISTKKACQDTIMQQAAAYITALSQTASYRNDGQQLTLLDSAGKTLATFSMQSGNLAGTSWTVTGYNDGKQAVVSVINGTKLTAQFSADGKLNGDAGCNTYMGTYETTDKNITVGQLATTRKMCAEPQGVMEQEAQFLKALESAATYRVDGDRLELRTADNSLAVNLARASGAASPTTTPTR